MKNQLMTFVILIFAIPAFGQNIERNISQEIAQLSRTEIKPIVSEIDIYSDEGDSIEIRSCYSNQKFLYTSAYNWLTLSGFTHSVSDSINQITIGCYDIVNIPKNASEEVKKRYIALKERHSNRYPRYTKRFDITSQSSKIPELQSTLQEVRF